MHGLCHIKVVSDFYFHIVRHEEWTMFCKCSSLYSH